MQAVEPARVRNAFTTTFAMLYGGLAAIDLTAVYADHDAWRPMTKTLLMPALIGVVLAASKPFDPARRWLAVGLVWSMLGDVQLLSRSDAAFVRGTLDFAAAHGCYIACFASAGRGRGLVRQRPWVAIPYVAAWVAVTCIVAPHMGALVFVAVPYSLLLTVMALCALDLVGRIPLPSAVCAATGAVLFLSSDSNIAFGRFVPALAPPHVEFVIMLLYVVGQAAIAAAFLLPVYAASLDGRKRVRARS